MARVAPQKDAFVIPKRKPVKSKDYLAFIGALPCVITGRSGVQVCHLNFARPDLGHFGRGKQTRAGDRWCLPMIPEKHAEQHTGNEKEFWRKHGIDPHVVALVLWGLFSDAGMDALDDCRVLLGRLTF